MINSLIKKYSIFSQIAKFAAIGLLNTGIDFAVLNLLMWQTGIYRGPWIILLNAISFVIAITNSYFWNKYWTFRSKGSAVAPLEIGQFVAVSLIGAGINSGIVYALTSFIPPFFGLSEELWANVAKIAATGLSLIWNFLGYKFIVFKKH